MQRSACKYCRGKSLHTPKQRCRPPPTAALLQHRQQRFVIPHLLGLCGHVSLPLLQV